MSNQYDNTIQHLTFSQQYGYEPLPAPMRPEEISEDLRRETWNVINRFLDSGIKYGFFEDEYKLFIVRVLGDFTKTPENEISTREMERIKRKFQTILEQETFNKFLDFLQIIVNVPNSILPKSNLINEISQLFEKHVAAYRLNKSNTSQELYQFVPRASKEQGEATKQAIETIAQNKMIGAASHLRKASKHINVQQYADSIRESIHAVESVARTIASEPCKSLGPALKLLTKEGVLKHQVLEKSFQVLYGYTNDEEGIRHPLLEKDTADVGLDEAVFMFGACASFAAYLSEKHRKTGNS